MQQNKVELGWKSANPAYDKLIAVLLREVGTVYIVGGTVRDSLLCETERLADLDIVIEQQTLPVARTLADRLGWAFYPMDPVRDIARLVFTANHGQHLICDISRMRGPTIEHDLTARDFTVNAMAIVCKCDTDPVLLDINGGQEDLSAGILRRMSPLSLLEDSIRLLRAPRLMVQLNLTIDPATRSQIERLSDTVRLCSPERERDELWRMLASSHPQDAIDLLDSFGLLSSAFPEVAATKGIEQSSPHYQDVYHHTLAVVGWAARIRDWLMGIKRPITVSDSPGLFEALAPHEYALRRHFSEALAVGHSRAEWLTWHALLHDIGKPATASTERDQSEEQGQSGPRIRFLGHEATGSEIATSRLEYLRFSRQEISQCTAVILSHMRLHHLHNSFPDGPISRRASFRFFRDIGGQQFGDLLGVDVIILALADYLGTYPNLPSDWPVYLSHAVQLLDDVFSTSEPSVVKIVPLVNGHQLMHHLNIQPGRRVGVLLDQLMEAQAAGEITTEAEAFDLAARLHANIEVGRFSNG